MRALITGGGGFVGRHLAQHLSSKGDEVTVIDQEVDVTSLSAVRAAFDSVRPDVVYHLAALAHVGESWSDPARYLEVNTIGTSNVLEAARGLEHASAVLVVSSAEVYGSVRPDESPLQEDRLLAPASPYAASKAAAEVVALQAARGFDQRVIVARPFNHIGPGQSSTFAVPAFAKRIVSAQAKGDDSLVVGNLSARRDFTDVRDVVAAYRLLVEQGESGEVYNVATGLDVSMEEIVERLQELAGASLSLEVDPALMRPVDIPLLRGDATKLRNATNWSPTYSLRDSLVAVLLEAQTSAQS